RARTARRRRRTGVGRRRAHGRPRGRRHPPYVIDLHRGARPLVIGHRGAAALAPENSLESVEAAVRAGVDGVELDVLRTRDGRLVLAHGPGVPPDAPT